MSYLLVTSSCFLVVAFLEGHFSPFTPALSSVVPTGFSHILTQVLCGDSAEGGMPAASVGALAVDGL